MITVISGTNRRNSSTLKFAQYYQQQLQTLTQDSVLLLDLCDLPNDFLHTDMYSEQGQSAALRVIQEKYMTAADKFIFIAPEYNGSVPGILKLFLDACSVHRMKDTFKRGDKKALLTGISSGRAGNLRGMIHLTGMLNYLNITVHPNQLPISQTGHIMDSEGKITDEATTKVIHQQLVEFLNF